MIRNLIFAMAASIAMTGCADPATQTKIDELTKRVEALEQRPAAGPGAAAAPSAAEQEAGEALRGINEKMAKLDYAGAKADCDQAMKKYASTRAFRRGARTCREVAVVGKEGKMLELDKWFQGEATLASGEPTLLVFWEQWCPHCKREVPVLEKTYNDYKGKMNVIGLTKVNRSATDEKVAEFITEKKVSYPMAKEKDGNWSQYYAVTGVPAAALVKDGKVVWRGHPAQLNRDGLLDKLLGS